MHEHQASQFLGLLPEGVEFWRGQLVVIDVPSDGGAAHGGGYLPSYAARSDYGCNRFAEACKPLKKHPTEYLRQLYFDSMVFTPEGLRHLVAECGVSQIMIGTDYPYPWSTTTVDHVLTTPGLSDADKRAILSGNAARLLKIPV